MLWWARKVIEQVEPCENESGVQRVAQRRVNLFLIESKPDLRQALRDARSWDGRAWKRTSTYYLSSLSDVTRGLQARSGSGVYVIVDPTFIQIVLDPERSISASAIDYGFVTIDQALEHIVEFQISVQSRD